MRLLLFSLLLLIALGQIAQGQQPGDSNPQSTAEKTAPDALSSSISIQKYRIWPGDILDVRVFAHPELTLSVTVDARGMIRLPQIAEEIQAACRTEKELRDEVVSRYKPQGNYQIFLRVREYKATPVIIKGGVVAPRSLELRRRMRLIEALAMAGGTTENATGEIRIKRSQAFTCEMPAPQRDGVEEKIVDVKDLMRGDESANLYLQPGDTITVSESDKVYVAGSVRRPTVLRMKTPLTVSQAIASAGGIQGARIERVQVCRQINKGSEVKIIDVSKGKAQDTLLQDEDVVYVSSEGGMGGGPPFCYPRPKKDAPDAFMPRRPIY